MRYRADKQRVNRYLAENAYKVHHDYLSESMSGSSGISLDAANLEGSPSCPYCDNAGWRPTKDKRLLECYHKLQFEPSLAQVMFVLDVTGSMEGEIEGVKHNIKAFIDYIKSEGLSVEVGLVAFRDLEMDEEPELLEFEGLPFTSDAASFKKKVSRLTASGGGGNYGESSFDALALACRQSFREEARKILVLITDEPPLLPDGKIKNVKDVENILQGSKIEQMHLVISSDLKEDYAFLHDIVKGQTFYLDEGKRGGDSFKKIITGLGKNITLMTRMG